MSSDFSGEEGRGYADDEVGASSSSSGVAAGQGAAATNSGNSSDLLADSDATEEVVINLDSTDAWDGKPRNWPVVVGYDWAPHEVRQISSSFHHRRPLKDFAGSVSLVMAAEDASHFKLAVCQMTERVCHGPENNPTDFFYAYATMFKDLKVLMPFSDFQMGVLRELNVAPTQLHPNGWAFMQAFSAICTGLALYPTPGAFLYFFHVQPHPSKPWVSLRTIGSRHLLSLFNSSYKDFKGDFFKVVPLEVGYQSFCFPDGRAKFPFYWTNNPRKVISWPRSRMTPEDLDLISQLSQLPPKSSSHTLIGFLSNKNLPSNVFDYLSKMDPAKSSTFARLFAQRGGDVRKPGGSSSCAPTTAVVPATSLPIQKAPPPPPTAEVPTPNSARRPADKAPPAEPIPKKKGKRKVVRELSAESKHAKRSLPDGPPLSGPLSPNSWVAKRIHFDLFAEEKALVSGMTEEEASNMAMELATRSTMCLAYAAQKRASASTEFQVLQEKFDAAVKSNQDLTLRLAETERMAEEDKKKASTLLAEARATQRRMQRSLDDAKLDLQKATASNTKLMAERDGLLADQDSLQDRLTKLEADNKFLGDEVMNEHLLGFEKALAQCNLLFQVPTDDPRLDVSMMVVDEKLVPIHVPPPSPPAVPTVEAVVEVIEETDGADVQP
ncbi:hypothetical protein LR48_Vigan04g044500 [Vigna angularis]|uniref:Transposase (putative) gypsy type domain-containing protein n=1 Tax=Phaseolus angularis TaxID=3914 RepID=A0A0L9UCG4_PHAAN|nr:hypothetical protein LR48_Vigan04g044500 [Vigna angularis]